MPCRCRGRGARGEGEGGGKGGRGGGARAEGWRAMERRGQWSSVIIRAFNLFLVNIKLNSFHFVQLTDRQDVTFNMFYSNF